MGQALQLAARGRLDVTENPMVGCVLVAGGRLLGQGWHRGAGLAHAEAEALADFGGETLPPDTTAYVTLEPCAHQGRTPPCADALLRAGVRRLVVACGDPDPRTAGLGLARLREAGVEVLAGVLQAQARWLLRGYLARQVLGRPWVLYKAAASLDGRTALADGASQWITAPPARALGQGLRAASCAVMVGSGTLLADDPSLRVRFDELPEELRELAGSQRQPLRVLWDSRGRCPVGAKALGEPGLALLLHGAQDGGAGLDCQREQIAPDAAGGLSASAALAALAARGCNHVLLEGGPTLAGALWRQGLIDELALMQAPIALGDQARPVLHTPPPPQLAQAERWRPLGSVWAGEDLCSRWANPASLRHLLGDTYNGQDTLSLQTTPWP